MSVGDFRRLPFRIFREAYRKRAETERHRERGEWERLRMLAAMLLSPHSKKTLTPRSVLPLPWDEKEKTATRAESLERVEYYRKHGRWPD